MAAQREVQLLVDELDAALEAAVVECCCCCCRRRCRCKTDSIEDLFELKEELVRRYEERVPAGPAKRQVIEERKKSIEAKIAKKAGELEGTCDCADGCCRPFIACCRRLFRRGGGRPSGVDGGAGSGGDESAIEVGGGGSGDVPLEEGGKDGREELNDGAVAGGSGDGGISCGGGGAAKEKSN